MIDTTSALVWLEYELRHVFRGRVAANSEDEIMNTAEMHNEIKELNLTYLMLAQKMLRDDKAGAMFRLGLSEEIAAIIERLTSGQLLKMAGTTMLLCRFRFDDVLMMDLLSGYQRDPGTAQMHAAILAAGKPVEILS